MRQFLVRARFALRAVLSPFTLPALLLLQAPVARAFPPANDFYSNATVISPAALPFSTTVTITEASTEGGEPFGCSFATQTVWYRFTPASDMWVSGTGSGVFGGLTVYRDNGGLFSLSTVACSQYTGQAIFLAHAGLTYSIQVLAQCCGVFGSVSIALQQVPPPTPLAAFSFYPSDPSAFDLVQFYDQSSDPGQQQITGHHYDWGDGTSGGVGDSTCCPTHRFTADGDYVVTLTVTTADGRSGSTTRTVNVRTHDVGVSAFKVPQSATAGQTKPITVSIKNTRYPEIVQVQLQKSIPGSYNAFQTVGTLQQLVVPKGGNKSTDFDFSYTFTPDDASIGKVTFLATAELVNTRDSYAGDNTATSDMVRVGNRASGRASTQGIEMNAAAGDLEFGPQGVTPNPVRAGADLAIRLAMPEAGEATVEALDLAGRVVASRDLGALEAGVHDVRLTWRERPAAGIYWVRATQAGHTSKAVRVAVLD